MSAVHVFGATFQNPVLLAAGTAGFGREVEDVIDLDALGGVVTKAVTPEPRQGYPSPRVAEFSGGMLNAVGLANPGLEAVARDHLPWAASRLTRARVIVKISPSSPRSRSTRRAPTRAPAAWSSALSRGSWRTWCGAAAARRHDRWS